jgi:hypothetical protein
MNSLVTPTLYDWLGGIEALNRLTVFAHMSADHPLLLETADDLEWGTRLAVINSQPGAVVEQNSPMPKWGWGEVKGPYSPKA